MIFHCMDSLILFICFSVDGRLGFHLLAIVNIGVVIFFIIATLVGIKYYLIGVLICISLVTNAVEHLSMCFLCLLWKVFKSFVHFKNWILIFLLLRL